MKRKNTRSLDEIANDIHKLERRSIFDIGDLLVEANAQCEHGEWLKWLEQFQWGWNTATRYMNVAKLGVKFSKLKNLALAATTLYALVDRDENDMPAIVAELAKYASKKQLAVRNAERIIKVAVGRHRFGAYPDSTLVQLAEVGDTFVEPWREKVITALKKQAPDTDEAAGAIVGKIDRERCAAETDALKRDLEAEHEDAKEAETILDGAPPELPPPATPEEAKRLSGGTDWAEAEDLARAVAELRRLQTKPMARLVGRVTSSELREVADLR